MKSVMITRKIGLKLVTDETDKKEYTREVMQYLRDAMFAQNKAFNLLTSRVYAARMLNQSDDEIKKIMFSYSHQAPKDNGYSILFLENMKKLAPIDEEKIEKEIKKIIKKNKEKEKPKSEKAIQTEVGKQRKKMEKFIGKTADEIQLKIDMNRDYCAYPSEVYEKFANGLSTPAYVKQQVEGYFKSYFIDIVTGKVAVRNMKKDNPLIVPSNCFKFEHDECEYTDFLDDLMNDRNVKVYFTMPYKKGYEPLRFELILGNPYRSHELRCIIQGIFEKHYIVRGSKLGFDTNKKSGERTNLVLMLTLEMPKEEVKLDENTVVGVDLGINIPAVCALNNDKYKRLFVGSGDDFIRMRTKIQNQNRRIKAQLKNSKGGHGRKRKLEAEERLMKHERNFAQTYNHKVSRAVVDFALKHHAKYINLECLKGYDKDAKILRNWSYYELQNYIEYKAARYGIEVRKVNPCFSSQVCSNCGHWAEDQRDKKVKERFLCGNSECDYNHPENRKGYINADFNAARNIAKISDKSMFIDESRISKIGAKEMETAKKYYGIDN